MTFIMHFEAKPSFSLLAIHLTIIPRVCVGNEMVDSQRGA